MNTKIIGLVAVLVIAGVAAMFAMKQSDTPQNFAEKSLKTLTTSSWDYSAFQAYAHESLERVVDQNKWAEMSSFYTRLGSLKSVNACNVKHQENMAKVDCEAIFAEAPATYNLELMNTGDKWEMTSMYIVSDLFKKPAAAADESSAEPAIDESAAEPAAGAVEETVEEEIEE